MRRMGLLLLTAMLAMAGTVCAGAEETDVLDQIEGYTFTFSSGVGGWSTDLVFGEDGSFSGEYHDSEMGESADEYPYGTVYYSSFSGQISLLEQADDNSWKVRVDKLEKDEVSESIDDNIRYVPSEPYGISEGDEMLLYSPGTPVSALSEDMQFWAHVNTQEDPQTELEDWFLSSEKNNSGFVGYDASAIANPWEDVTKEELLEASGQTFGVPEGAENVIYRYMAEDNLAEMQFTIGDDEYCARIKPADQAENISGMYFEWDDEKEVDIVGCAGTTGRTKTGSEDWVGLCQWYDEDSGLQYSLSVYTTDIENADLTALAEQIYTGGAE